MSSTKERRPTPHLSITPGSYLQPNNCLLSLSLFCEKRCVELDRTVRFNYPWDLSAAGQDAALTSTPPNLNPPTGLKWPGLARQLVAKTEIGLIPPWFTGPEGHPCQSLPPGYKMFLQFWKCSDVQIIHSAAARMQS